METDLIWISAAAGFHKPLVVITGDANLQPISLGGGADISLARDVRWVAFMSRWPLILQNPSLLGQMRLPVLLPARGRNVHIRPSDTHHGEARAVRLTWLSQVLMFLQMLSSTTAFTAINMGYVLGMVV